VSFHQIRAIAMAVAATLASTLAVADVRESFDTAVASAPIAVDVDGHSQLVYEIHVTNFGDDDLSLVALRILDADTRAPIGEFRGAELARRFSVVAGNGAADPTLQPGRRGVVFVELDLPRGKVPAALDHRIEYSRAARGEKLVADGPHVGVDRAEPPSLGPPLKGGP
jgi:murein DD-endopeptidase